MNRADKWRALGTAGVVVFVLLMMGALVASGSEGQYLPDDAVMEARTEVPSPTPNPWDCEPQLHPERPERFKRGEEISIEFSALGCDFEPEQLVAAWPLPPSVAVPAGPPAPTAVSLLPLWPGYTEIRVDYSGQIRATGAGDQAWTPATLGVRQTVLVHTQSSVAVVPLSNGGFAAANVHPVDGALLVTESLDPNSAPAWIQLSSRSMGADIAQSTDGALWVAAVGNEGRLESWTTDTARTTWSMAPVAHGQATWDRAAAPAIAALPNGGVVMAAVKLDGRLYTREASPAGVWGSWQRHGLAHWSRVALAVGDDGTTWLAGVKEDGRLYTRSADANGTWGPFTLHGRSTWDPLHAPSILALPDGSVALVATKADGRLYTRTGHSTGWFGWQRHGSGRWAGADLAVGTDGRLWLAALNDDGHLYTRSALLGQDTWTGLARHRNSTVTSSFSNGERTVSFDSTESPSIAIDANGTVLVTAANADQWGSSFSNYMGAVHWRFFTSSWSDWEFRGYETG